MFGVSQVIIMPDIRPRSARRYSLSITHERSQDSVVIEILMLHMCADSIVGVLGYASKVCSLQLKN